MYNNDKQLNRSRAEQHSRFLLPYVFHSLQVCICRITGIWEQQQSTDDEEFCLIASWSALNAFIGDDLSRLNLIMGQVKQYKNLLDNAALKMEFMKGSN